MFKSSLIAFFLIFFINSASLAMSNAVVSDKKMSLSVDLLDLVWGEIPLGFRFAISDRVVLGASAYVGFFDFFYLEKLSFGGGIHAKFHLSDKAFKDGWWVKPEMRAGYLMFKTKGSAEKLRFATIMPNVMFGYDWVWSSGFMISLGLGVAYRHSFVDASVVKKGLNWTMKGPTPTGDFSFGWAF